MFQAVRQGPAPSTRAASITSSGMLLSAPYMTTIQPPAPVQKAISTKMTGRLPGAITWSNVLNPSARRRPVAGLTDGVSMNSQTSTLADAGERAGKIEEEPQHRRQAGPHPCRAGPGGTP